MGGGMGEQVCDRESVIIFETNLRRHREQEKIH